MDSALLHGTGTIAYGVRANLSGGVVYISDIGCKCYYVLDASYGGI